MYLDRGRVHCIARGVLTLAFALAFAGGTAQAADTLHFAVGPLQPTPGETKKAFDPFFKHLAEQRERTIVGLSGLSIGEAGRYMANWLRGSTPESPSAEMSALADPAFCGRRSESGLYRGRPFRLRQAVQQTDRGLVVERYGGRPGDLRFAQHVFDKRRRTPQGNSGPVPRSWCTRAAERLNQPISSSPLQLFGGIGCTWIEAGSTALPEEF